MFIHENHIKASAANYGKMLDTGHLTDVELVSGGKHIRCHKVVLSAVSQYFYSMLSVPMQENHSDVITLPGIHEMVLEDLIHYLYVGKIEITPENVQELLYASDMIDIPELKHACVTFYEEQMTSANCLGIWAVAVQLNVSSLINKAKNFALGCFNDVVVHDEFLVMSLNDVVNYLKDHGLKTTSEQMVLEAVLTWLEGGDNRDWKQAISGVNFTDIDPAYIRTIVLQRPKVKKIPAFVSFLEIVINHLVFNTPAPPDFPVLSPRMYTSQLDGLFLISKDTIPQKYSLSYVHVNADHTGRMKSVLPLFSDAVLAHMASCSVGNKVYVSCMGGSNKWMKKYCTVFHKWTDCRPFQCERMWYNLVYGYSDTLYALGGCDSNSVECSLVEKYTISQNSVSSVGSLMQPVSKAGCVFYNGKLIIIGGQNQKKAVKNIQVFDVTTNCSYMLNVSLQKPCVGITASQFRQQLLVVGSGFCITVPLDFLNSIIDLVILEGSKNFSPRKLRHKIYNLGGKCMPQNVNVVGNLLFAIGKQGENGEVKYVSLESMEHLGRKSAWVSLGTLNVTLPVCACSVKICS